MCVGGGGVEAYKFWTATNLSSGEWINLQVKQLCHFHFRIFSQRKSALKGQNLIPLEQFLFVKSGLGG